MTPGGGRAFVFSSGLILVILTLSGMARAQGRLFGIQGGHDRERLGVALDGLGDVDEDGIPDFIAGTPNRDAGGSGKGYVRIFSGRHAGVLRELHGSQLRDGFGESVAGAGDLDGDSHPDYLIGMPHGGPGNVGLAFALSGRDGLVLFTVQGDRTGSTFGATLRGVGDLDADGFVDVAVGAPRRGFGINLPGHVSAFSGRDGSSILVLNGRTAKERLGWSLGPAGDVDQDGHDDLFVGSRDDDTVEFARVISGKDGATIRTLVEHSGYGSTTLGVDGGVHLDSDGIPDLVATRLRLAGPIGRVHAYSGASGALLWYGAAGAAVRVLDDLDGDGTPDVLVGNPGYPQTGGMHDPDDGIAHLMSGIDGTEIFRVDGEPESNLGWSVAPLGDVNGNGVGEFLVGSPGLDLIRQIGQIELFAGRCGSSQVYGAGCPGTQGFVPVLSATAECPAPGAQITLRVTAPEGPMRVALILAGTTEAQLALGLGCDLLVFPIDFTVPLLINDLGPGPGGGAITGWVPHTFSPGQIHLQAMVPDAGVPKGYALSNGIAMDLR